MFQRNCILLQKQKKQITLQGILHKEQVNMKSLKFSGLISFYTIQCYYCISFPKIPNERNKSFSIPNAENSRLAYLIQGLHRLKI